MEAKYENALKAFVSERIRLGRRVEITDLPLESEISFINKIKRFISAELNSDYNVNVKHKQDIPIYVFEDN